MRIIGYYVDRDGDMTNPTDVFVAFNADGVQQYYCPVTGHGELHDPEYMLECKQITCAEYKQASKNFYTPVEYLEEERTTRYVITGILKNGKRFKPIHTDTPQHYNIWQGTIWERLPDGKRKKVREVWN